MNANWITPKNPHKDICPVFRKRISGGGAAVRAELSVTACGVYAASLNGQRIGDFVLAPGWTDYRKRLQFQTYDITSLWAEENELLITVGRGWARSPLGWDANPDDPRLKQPPALLAELVITHEDGSVSRYPTGTDWESAESPVRFSEIYNGESCDMRIVPHGWEKTEVLKLPMDTLIPQEGDIIREQERIAAKAVLITPAGETVVDFGQNITGYVEFTADAEAGDEVKILHGEVLDADGNFYNANYRKAKAEINVICRGGTQTWKPLLTFFGFRYLKLEKFPGSPVKSQFTAIAVYSDMKPTGTLECGHAKLNQLFSNILWGQRGNFLDIPTDCPQRDERLGWTGDAQVFVKAASYNYDVEKFFVKWLHDLSASQYENGGVPFVVPDCLNNGDARAAWGDAAVICPWQIYLTYGDKEILRTQFPSMKKWVDFITAKTTTPYLWTGAEQFGDWLGLDAPEGSYKGSSRDDLLASAYYARSMELLIKAGSLLGEDMEAYRTLRGKLADAYRAAFPEYKTQTEYAVSIMFGLAPDPAKSAAELAEMIRRDGVQLKTGFLGTPYLLHVLSGFGYTELAYDLLLREDYPSWLYPLSKGATTIWEHWDGIREDGGFWSSDMNSFNHYAYGSVADWIYEKAAGIQPLEDAPGFGRVVIAPMPDRRLGWLKASIHTRHGLIRSQWSFGDDGAVRFEIETCVPATVVIAGTKTEVSAGRYVFWSH